MIMQILAHVGRLIKCGFLSFKITDYTRNISIENAYIKCSIFFDDIAVNFIFIVIIKEDNGAGE